MDRDKLVGENIKKLREARGWSQVQLADLSGVAGPTINRIENGLRSGRGETLKKIADALNVTLDELLSDDVETSVQNADLEQQLLAEFRTADNKEEIVALVRTYKRMRNVSAGSFSH